MLPSSRAISHNWLAISGVQYTPIKTHLLYNNAGWQIILLLLAIVKHWLAKICLLVAVMLITAHNVIPHDHIEQKGGHGHHHHHKNENVFSHDLLAHSFVQRSVEFDVVNQLTIGLPDVFIAATPVLTGASTPQLFPCKIYYIKRGNLPPPLYNFSSASFRGPPARG